MRKFLSTISLFISLNSVFSQENNITTSDSEAIKNPILETCMEKSNDKKKIRCTNETITDLLFKKINRKNIPDVLDEVKIMIKFSINESGEANDIQIIRSTCTNTSFKEDVATIFSTIPKFHISNETQPYIAQSYILPITLIINKSVDNNRHPRPPKTRSPRNPYN